MNHLYSECKNMKLGIHTIIDGPEEKWRGRIAGRSEVHPEPRFRQESHQSIQSLRILEDGMIVHDEVPHLAEKVGAVEQHIDFRPLDVKS